MGLFDNIGSGGDFLDFGGKSTLFNPAGNVGMGNFQRTVDPIGTRLGLNGKAPKPGGGGSQLDDFLSMYPQYNQAYDPNTMSLTKRMEELSPQYDKGINAYRDEALRKGPSGWLNQAKMSGALKEQTEKEQGQQSVAGQTAQAQGNLAAQGGLSSGARERVGEQGIKNYMNMSQDVARQGMQNDLNLNVQDQQHKLSALQALPGMEQQRLEDFEKARQGDITNQLGENARKNQYSMDLYKTKAEAMAAERQAQATENSGKK